MSGWQPKLARLARVDENGSRMNVSSLQVSLAALRLLQRNCQREIGLCGQDTLLQDRDERDPDLYRGGCLSIDWSFGEPPTTRPRLIGEYNYSQPYPQPSSSLTALPL